MLSNTFNNKILLGEFLLIKTLGNVKYASKLAERLYFCTTFQQFKSVVSQTLETVPFNHSLQHLFKQITDEL